MKDLTILLIERLCLLLIIAFVVTRIPGFRSLVYKELNMKMILLHVLVFGLFGIIGTTAGVIIDTGHIEWRQFVLSAGEDQYVVSLSLVAIVIAGLLAGPYVGLGAGIIAGLHLFFLGGIGVMANVIVNPLTGFLAGWSARFFSNERVISPFKALFIGVFPPILQMQLLLIFDAQQNKVVDIVDTIGLPLVLSNSLAIAIFTAIIAIVLREQENEAAAATKRALAIVEDALPFIRKDTDQAIAEGLADLLYERLGLAAVSVANKTEILAYRGLASDHHLVHDSVGTAISLKALETKKMQIAYSKEDIQCAEPDCPLEAGIVIPIVEADEVTWLVKFYFKKAQHIRPEELTLAEGLEQLMSHQLSIVAAEKLTAHMRDAELRNLQAQINPYFLINTLHLIASMFRENPEKARHITVQLAQFMRFNLRLVSKSLVDIHKEIEHVQPYATIIQERFAGRMEINFEMSPNLQNLKIPPSTIQPLVENSVQHGLKDVFQKGKVVVQIYYSTNQLSIKVQDNGCGFKEDILKRVTKESTTSDGGTGLYNVNKRLISLLGKEAELQINNLPDCGSEVAFNIPIHIMKSEVTV